MLPRDRISDALKDGLESPRLVAFMTAGYPNKKDFLATLHQVAGEADVVELGVPFTDPMADGVTIQRSSQGALEQGVTLRWILNQLEKRDFELEAPVLLMSYLNPLLTFGFDELAARSAEVGVDGFIVPDLPLDESAPLIDALEPHGLALVQLVTPATPEQRMKRVSAASTGFLYAVTTTGITGGGRALPAELTEYLDRVKSAASIPVCAGFGIRRRDQVEKIAGHAHGVIVGSALVEVLESGDDPGAFLQQLREPG